MLFLTPGRYDCLAAHSVVCAKETSLHFMQNLNDVLPLMASRDVNQLPVVQNGAPVGVVSRDGVMRYLEVQRSLGGDASQGDSRKQWPRAA